MRDTAAERPNQRHRLPEYAAGHLRFTDAAIDELDRDLDDAKSRPQGPIAHLDLESIPAGRDGAEIDSTQRGHPTIPFDPRFAHGSGCWSTLTLIKPEYAVELETKTT